MIIKIKYRSTVIGSCGSNRGAWPLTLLGKHHFASVCSMIKLPTFGLSLSAFWIIFNSKLQWCWWLPRRQSRNRRKKVWPKETGERERELSSTNQACKPSFFYEQKRCSSNKLCLACSYLPPNDLFRVVRILFCTTFIPVPLPLPLPLLLHLLRSFLAVVVVVVPVAVAAIRDCVVSKS